MSEGESGAGHDTELKSKLIRSVGTHRAERALSPVEVAHALDYFASRGSLKAICEEIGLDTSTAGRFLRLLSLPTSAQSVVDWGSSKTTISFSAASELAGISSADDRRAAANLALRNRMTKDELRQAVQVHRRAGTTIVEAIEGVLARRPQLVTVEVFIGAVPERLRSRVTAMPQAERDASLRTALRNVLPADASVRMTPQHYTITTDAPLANTVVAQLDDLVTTHLAETVK